MLRVILTFAHNKNKNQTDTLLYKEKKNNV